MKAVALEHARRRDCPPAGAHVATPRLGYVHHGICVGDGRVVHYAGLSGRLRRGPIQEVSLDEFTGAGGIWFELPTLAVFDAAEVVRRARSRLGEDHYRLLTNNCEHFCYWCLRGEPRSYQIERRFGAARAMRAVRRAVRGWLVPGAAGGYAPARPGNGAASAARGRYRNRQDGTKRYKHLRARERTVMRQAFTIALGRGAVRCRHVSKAAKARDA
jgi:hypothetical protein